MLMRWLKKYVHLFDVGCVITQSSKGGAGVTSTAWEESEGIQRAEEHSDYRQGAKDPSEVAKTRAEKKSDFAQSVDYGLEFVQNLKDIRISTREEEIREYIQSMKDVSEVVQS